MTNQTTATSTTREPSEFAVVKIRSGMAVSDFLFDSDEDARAFFLAASNIHNMGKGRNKCAMFPIGHDVMDQWKF